MYDIRLMCDLASDGPEDYTSSEPFCYAKRQCTGEHASITSKTEVNDAIIYINTHAKTHGWIKTPTGWRCPNCKTIT